MNTLHIDTKSRFNNLSDIDKENVLLFLTDRFTEEYVCIKQHEDGLITVQDYQESEFSELSDKRGYVKRDTLIKRLTIVDYDNFVYIVDASHDKVFPTIRANDATVFTVRHDDVDDKTRVYFHYSRAFYNAGKKEETLAQLCSRISNGKSKVVTREVRIKERHAHDVSHGASHNLEQYQDYTSHDNLRNLYIETEEGLTEEELNYVNFNNSLWSMTNANGSLQFGGHRDNLISGE
jgi:hypothetical protein